MAHRGDRRDGKGRSHKNGAQQQQLPHGLRKRRVIRPPLSTVEGIQFETAPAPGVLAQSATVSAPPLFSNNIAIGGLAFWGMYGILWLGSIALKQEWGWMTLGIDVFWSVSMLLGGYWIQNALNDIKALLVALPLFIFEQLISAAMIGVLCMTAAVSEQQAIIWTIIGGIILIMLQILRWYATRFTLKSSADPT